MFRRDLPWFRGNLHVHTTRSDGRRTLEEMHAIYRGAGYDFVAVTDHETPYLQGGEGPLLLSGVEFAYQQGRETVHLIGAGFTHAPQKGTCVQQGIDAINAAGGVAILAHPAWSLNSTALICSFRGLLAAEVYNSISAPPYNADRADSAAVMDSAFAAGARMGLVASDDTHFYGAELFRGYTMVNAAACTREALLEALRAGRYYATQGPAFEEITVQGQELYVRCSPCSLICVADDLPWVPGRAVVQPGVQEFTYRIDDKETVLRVQLQDAYGRKAWSRPLFRTGEGGWQ